MLLVILHLKSKKNWILNEKKNWNINILQLIFKYKKKMELEYCVIEYSILTKTNIAK